MPRRKLSILSGLAGLLASVVAAHAQIKMGVAGPLTGDAAVFGDQIQVGVEQAAKDLNAKGGILGQKIKVVLGDDRSDPDQGVAVAKNFAREGVKYVVGDFNSGVSIASSLVYESHGVVQITPSSTNPAFTERGLWNVFRTCGRSGEQAQVAASYIAAHFKNKPIAIVDDRSTYGEALSDQLAKDLRAGAIPVALRTHVAVGQPEEIAILERMKRLHIALVYWGGFQTEGGLLLKHMREKGVAAAFMGGDGLAARGFASAAGKHVAGALMTFAPDPEANPHAANLAKELAARPSQPGPYAYYSYAAVQVIHQAAKAATSLDPRKVAAKIHSGMIFHTVLGDLSFDRSGDRRTPDEIVYAWKIMSDGKPGFTPAQ